MKRKQILKYIGRSIYGSFWLLGLLVLGVVRGAGSWYASIGFLQFFVPVFLGIFFIWFIYRLFKFRWTIILPGIALIWGFPFFTATFAWNWASKSSEDSFEVLSYNVRVFNSYDNLAAEKPGSSAKMIQWLAEHPADIKCVQEFFHSCHRPGFNTIKELAESSDYYYAFQMGTYQYPLHYTGGYFGKTIFSRYPIIHSETFYLSEPASYHQSGLLADIVIREDTLRVMNVHLQSLYLNDKKIFRSERTWKKTWRKYRELFQRLQKGYRLRASQANFLEKHIQNSPYPVILCGDFNDLPYSYTYQRIRKNLKNSFEKGDWGFGFSYNGRIPFLRIDNQFFSNSIELQNFQTLHQIPYSDHFPTLGKYQFQ